MTTGKPLTLLFSLLLTACLCGGLSSQAKAGFGDEEDGGFVTADDEDPDPGQDPDLPLDDGVIYLVGAGIAYGLFKMYSHKSKVQP